MQVHCVQKAKCLLECLWTDGRCGSWSLQVPRCWASKILRGLGNLPFIFRAPFWVAEWQHIDTTVHRHSRSVAEVPHPCCAKPWSCTKIHPDECRYLCWRSKPLWAWGPPSALRLRKLQRGQIPNSLDLVDPPGTLRSSVLEEGFGECLDCNTQREPEMFRFHVVCFLTAACFLGGICSFS